MPWKKKKQNKNKSFIERANIYSIPVYTSIIAHNKGFPEKSSPFLSSKSHKRHNNNKTSYIYSTFDK